MLPYIAAPWILWVGPHLGKAPVETVPGSDSDGSLCVDGARISVEEPVKFCTFCGSWIDKVPSGYLLHSHGQWPIEIDCLPIENGDFPWLC
jgi:hypothetical protein